MTTPDAGKPAKPRIVRCPHCGGDSVYAPSNPYRPFCSERCKNYDLGAWASESDAAITKKLLQPTSCSNSRQVSTPQRGSR